MEMFISEMAKEKPIRFRPQQLEAFTRNYSKVLGSGGFGVVYEGAFPHGERIAVKVLNSKSSKRVKEQFMAEVSTIGRTYHVNLVRLYGFCFDKTTRALVYEYMENGSLDNFLFNSNNNIEWETLHKIAVGTAKGIAYLHEDCQKRIIHYDIKPGNILLDSSFCPKVADFGLAQLCNRESTHVPITGYRGGTPGYAAPELWKTDPVTFKCDVYSFGMLLFELIGRRRNLDVNVSEAREWLPRWIWENFRKGQLGEIMELYTIDEENQEKAERMSMVALWCVQYLPDPRPLMSTVVKMLEGEENIIPPPNPFEYLETESQNAAFVNGDSEGTNSSCFASFCLCGRDTRWN
ncbi:non-specific serine/threonine protein kinase [Ranunculus cassubicifolius]